MKKKILLTVVAAAAITVSTQAQAVFLKANVPYTFSGNSVTGTGTISYQWYRDGQPISGATSQNYTMSGGLANGSSVEIKRGAVSSSCPYNVSLSNRFIVTFVNCMQVGTACWAQNNVDAYQVFAVQPDMHTQFYQWNRIKAWPASGSVGSGWSSSTDNSTSWATVNDPCPSGWRVPTNAEMTALVNSGSTWVTAGTRGSAVNGRFFGTNNGTPAQCTLPDNMNDCIFLPANGGRGSTNGAHNEDGSGGYYWSATQYNASNGYRLEFKSASISSSANYSKADGDNIRCVLN